MPGLPISDRKLLSIRELSSASGIPVGTLRRWVKKGRIQSLQPGGRGGKLYFAADAIQRAGTEETAPDASVPADTPKSGRTPAWMQ